MRSSLNAACRRCPRLGDRVCQPLGNHRVDTANEASSSSTSETSSVMRTRHQSTGKVIGNGRLPGRQRPHLTTRLAVDQGFRRNSGFT